MAALAVVLVMGVGGRSLADQGRGKHKQDKVWPRDPYPSSRAVRRAQEFAAERGDVSFAVIDDSIGLRGYDPDRQFSSASVSKALLLAAELRRLDRDDLPLDESTKALLEPMVTYSDNHAADAVYAQVGDEGLEEVARACGDDELRGDAGLLGRRSGHGRRPGALLLPARGEPARPSSRLREGTAREDHPGRALGDPAGDRPRLVRVVQGWLAPGRPGGHQRRGDPPGGSARPSRRGAPGARGAHRRDARGCDRLRGDRGRHRAAARGARPQIGAVGSRLSWLRRRIGIRVDPGSWPMLRGS